MASNYVYTILYTSMFSAKDNFSSSMHFGEWMNENLYKYCMLFGVNINIGNKYIYLCFNYLWESESS